jgi:hypothetical protein
VVALVEQFRAVVHYSEGQATAKALEWFGSYEEAKNDGERWMQSQSVSIKAGEVSRIFFQVEKRFVYKVLNATEE